ncbi:hypothetical protein FF38_09673 [Lucilia cuprina]|uniref:Chitin-binding type-2 domain-containing protein n=1 Tax=Lucilia cuprina TaxID=7375 RepID=A0A0L0CT88_LUCCU|nr:hypothetical protein FF38_09673 [Lucilia cuprina]
MFIKILTLLVLMAFYVPKISAKVQGAKDINTQEEEALKNIIYPLCLPSQTYQIPYPFNCYYYYECINGVVKIKRCPLGLAFDWVQLRCVPKAEVICGTFIN